MVERRCRELRREGRDRRRSRREGREVRAGGEVVKDEVEGKEDGEVWRGKREDGEEGVRGSG